MKRIIVISTLIITLFSACKTNHKAPEEASYFREDSLVMLSEASEVIYALSLPTDMSVLIEESGYNFNPDLPASTENASRYSDSSQIAVILGIYGVDLSYAKLYNQASGVADYYNTLKILSNKLTVPESIFERSRQAVEKAFNNPDSLTEAIKMIYRETDSYFRNSDKEQLASLSLMGGWTEAMYIGVSLYRENESKEMRERILQQKYALNSIISLLSNYQEDQRVTVYLLMLKKLRNQYNKVDILYAKEGFNVDTANHTLQIKGALFDYDPETMENICSIVVQIRNELLK